MKVINLLINICNNFISLKKKPKKKPDEQIMSRKNFETFNWFLILLDASFWTFLNL